MTALVLVILGFLLLGFDGADFTITGLSLLAAILIGIGLWLGGAFSADAWFVTLDADDERGWSDADRAAVAAADVERDR